jgi:acyl-CoA thioesterase
MKTFDEELVKDRINRFPFVKLMGMRLLSCTGGKSVMQCRVRQLLRNSGGTLHGGVVGALVDMSVATALRSVLPLSSRMTTVEYKVNFLKPVAEGTITAHGSVIRLGKTIAVGSTEIRNDAGEPVAFGSATFYVLNARAPGDSPGIMVGTKGRKKPVLSGES